MSHLLFYGVVILISVNNTRQILMSGNQFKNIGSIEELFANETDKRPVMVSVKCLAYNHEKFIRQALDGFVMQKTNFRYEVLIHDDASTDSTAAIITEYAEKYPDIIKPLLEKENLFSKPDGDHINQTILPALRGKYIALCEGDDYWTDPNKLQKQVDFMESHPDFTFCFHNAILHFENGSQPDKPFTNLETREYSEKELIDDWKAPTAAFLFPSKILNSPIYQQVLASKKLIVGDNPLMRTCMHYGRAYAFAEPMSVYRIQPTGATQHLNDLDNVLKLMEQEAEYMKIFGGYSITRGKKYIGSMAVNSIFLFRNREYGEGFRVIAFGLKKASIKTFVGFFNLIKRLNKNPSDLES